MLYRRCGFYDLSLPSSTHRRNGDLSFFVKEPRQHEARFLGPTWIRSDLLSTPLVLRDLAGHVQLCQLLRRAPRGVQQTGGRLFHVQGPAESIIAGTSQCHCSMPRFAGVLNQR